MSTKIEWAEETWNPFTGCSPISEGCQNCYAKRMANRLRGRYGYPEDNPFRVTFHKDRLEQPYKWRRKPRRIFVCSMGDIFHEDINLHGEDLRWVFRQMVTEDQHQYMVLTKRPKRMRAFILNQYDCFPDHIWVGVTAENQDRADERLSVLREIPAPVKFVSFEPLLSEIDATPYLDEIDMAIVGGETGPRPRYMHPQWVRYLLAQCRNDNTAFFMKKMSSGKEPPPDLMIRQWPETT